MHIVQIWTGRNWEDAAWFIEKKRAQDYKDHLAQKSEHARVVFEPEQYVTGPKIETQQ